MDLVEYLAQWCEHHNLFNDGSVYKEINDLFEREYVTMLVDKIDSEQIFRTVNASIGRFLADNQMELRIVKNGREASRNVKGHETENQGWIKTL